MTPIRMARVETGVRVIIQLIECFNRHDADKMTDLFSENVTLDDFSGSTNTGRDSVVVFFSEIFQKNPEMILETEELVGYGYRCTLRWNIKQDKKSDVSHCKRGLTLFLVRGDQICEINSYSKLRLRD